MPLKPIFDKAPLTAMACQPLRAGLVRSEDATLKQLYALAAADQSPAMLEGAFRLACIVTSRPAEEPVTARIHALLDTQKPDGSFDASMTESICILRAAWALYEYEARKPVLEHIVRWCAWFAQQTDAVSCDDELWANAADLLELLEHLYRVTGKAALLTLCERVSNQSMVWSSVLNTVSTQRPTCRSMTREEMQAGLSRENGSREGFYGHYLRANHPEKLADGARSALAKGLYSGSATEANATRTAWERLTRYHGAVCGGLTSDELLEGTAPAMAMSTAGLGAWAEALCCAATADKANWAWEAIECMAVNAMPAALMDGMLLPVQRVNCLTAQPDTKDCFMLSENLPARALRRLVRGFAAVCSCAVTAYPNGFGINLYRPGKYAVPVGEQLMMLSVGANAQGYAVTVHVKAPVKASVRLRIPSWSRNTDVTINGMDNDIGKNCIADVMAVDRTWNDGDVLNITLEENLRVADGHHQGRYILKGATLMALPVTENAEWACALVDARMEYGCVVATVDPVKEWKRRGDVPADVPVLPAASGEALRKVPLVPYAKAPARIALFAGRHRA